MFIQGPVLVCTFTGYPKQRSAVPRNGLAAKPDLQAREAERQLVQRLKDRSEQQARQLGAVRGELRRAVCGFEALAVAMQHFFRKVRPQPQKVPGSGCGAGAGVCVCKFGFGV